MEVVPVEIGGSTRSILPKPHLIIPDSEARKRGNEREREREREREKIEGGIYGNTGKFS